ncbi:HdeD family acid-resistance protein [Actinocorallia sp. B10E7]|uniref:HdeD family acid-resistance protein n=1 Tax=Actinocorallia sp. B10E7 TaxID=3153558 RepID=UPI00325E97ED
MLEEMTRNWWMLALRGGLAILFGVLAWAWPGITALALALLFGAYALVDGAVALFHALKGGVRGQSRAWLALSGACGIVVGILALFWPAATVFALILLIGIWAIATGVTEIVAAIWMRRQIAGEGWHILSGGLSVLFGLALLAWPGTGGLALIWLIGVFSIAFGIALVVAAFRLRSLRQRIGSPRPGTHAI